MRSENRRCEAHKEIRWTTPRFFVRGNPVLLKRARWWSARRKKGRRFPEIEGQKGATRTFATLSDSAKNPPPVEPPVAVASPASSASTVNVALQPAAVPSSQPTLPVVASRPSVTPAPAVSLPPPAAPSAAPNVRVAASAPAPAEPPPIATAPVIPVKPVVPELKPVAPTVPEKVEKTDTIDSWEKVAGAKLGESQATAGKLRATEKGEREVVSALGKRTLLIKKRAFALADPQLTFIADKLAAVSARARRARDQCESLLSSMATAWGPATASAEMPKEASVWKGDTVGVRVAVDKKDCWVLIVHRPSAKESDWLSLEP